MSLYGELATIHLDKTLLQTPPDENSDDDEEELIDDGEVEDFADYDSDTEFQQQPATGASSGVDPYAGTCQK